MHLLKDQKDWISTSILNKNTGKRIPRFFYRRKKAPFVRIDSNLSRALAGYTLIERDLRTVSAWIGAMERMQTRDIKSDPGWSLYSDDREEDVVVKALFVSAITFYAKCFTKAAGRNIKLEKSNLPPEFHSSHEEIMEMRHNYGAHGGTLEAVDIYLVMHPSRKHIERHHVLMRNSFQPEVMYDLPDAKYGFQALTTQARNFAVAKIDTLNDLIFEKEIRPKGMGYWYKRGKR